VGVLVVEEGAVEEGAWAGVTSLEPIKLLTIPRGKGNRGTQKRAFSKMCIK
jgi:hypothetical protein